MDGTASVVQMVLSLVAVVAMIVLVAAQSASDPAADSGALSLSSGAPMVRGPDLSTMTPRERADRLFNRVMSYHERGMSDSVAFFADMGISALTGSLFSSVARL